jgi:hypothetical protein
MGAHSYIVAILLLTSVDAGAPSRAAPPVPVALPIVEGEGYQGVIFPAPPFNPRVVDGDGIWCPSDQDVRRLEASLEVSLKDALRDPQRSINSTCRPEESSQNWCREFERRRKAEVKAILAKLRKYRRQYAGVTISGKRTIIANFFRPPSEDDSTNWRSEWVNILGGGTDYWSIAFNIEQKRFHSLYVNSPR